TRPSALGDYGIDVGYGEVRFEPAMFNFPLAEYGHPDQGLALESTAGGRTSHVARLYEHSAVALAGVSRQLVDDPARTIPGERDARGRYIVPFEKARIDDFWWRRMTYGFTAFEPPLVGGGRIVLQHPWMNLEPA